MIPPLVALALAMQEGGSPKGSLTHNAPLVAALHGQPQEGIKQSPGMPSPMMRAQFQDPRNMILRALGGM